MSKLGINTGSVPNDGTGDNLLSGAVKINSNFTEIYSAIGDNSNLLVGVGKTVLSIKVTGNVGIASTNPSSKLSVVGDAFISGIVTANSFAIGSTQIVNSSRQLQNITSLDATTTSTIESAISFPPNTFTDLSITGISTLQSTTLIGGGSSTGQTATVLQVVGVNSSVYIAGNLGINKINPSTRIDVVGDGRFVGVVTAVTFLGQIYDSTVGSSSTITSLSGTTVNYPTGYFNTGIITTINSVTGIITNISGIGISYSGIATFRNGPVLIGAATSTGTANQVLQVAGVSSSAYIGGNLGLGHTNPTQKFDVIGNANFTGIVTASVFNGNLNATGVTTFTTGSTVLIGTGTSTGTANQVLQVAGVSSSAYIGGQLGIGSTIPVTTLDVAGTGRFTGIVTATVFNGNVNSTGVSTFTTAAGPVLVGGGTSTGTAAQVLQVTGISSNAYIGGRLGIGVTNNTSVPLLVSGIASATTIIDGIGTNRTIPQNAQSPAAYYTATSSDIGKHISVSAGTGVTVNASVFSPGDVFYIFNNTAGNITIGPGTNVTLYLSGNANSAGIRTMASRTLATVLCVGSNTFVAGAAAGAATGGPIN